MINAISLHWGVASQGGGRTVGEKKVAQKDTFAEAILLFDATAESELLVLSKQSMQSDRRLQR